MNVSKYQISALYKARHTDELEEDGNVHVRIDYKMSGVGSNACGPALASKYRLEEKNIEFGFSIRPQLQRTRRATLNGRCEKNIRTDDS